MNVAILGVGTVGESVAKILLKNKKLIAARCGEEIGIRHDSHVAWVYHGLSKMHKALFATHCGYCFSFWV